MKVVLLYFLNVTDALLPTKISIITVKMCRCLIAKSRLPVEYKICRNVKNCIIFAQFPKFLPIILYLSVHTQKMYDWLLGERNRTG